MAVRKWRAALLGLSIMIAVQAGGADESTLARARQSLLRELSEMAADTSFETGSAGLDERVLRALGKVPRHRFVPEHLVDEAYENRPLPIGQGQTISQPYIVALMTDLLRLKRDARVLEVGTGSGYQAAVLAEFTPHVYSMEIIEPLARRAQATLRREGYAQVQVRLGDGYYGWPEAAPFDAIIVTAAASHIPGPLVKQLKAGGRMVIPVGTHFLTQHLLLVEKRPDGGVTTRQILPVSFVPLTGGH
jgi:protein-L-isoaspartate(D-aspartate) O-methyltransferase